MIAALVRIAVWALAGLAAGALAALLVLPEAGDRLFPSSTMKTTGEALIGGPFALTDHTGRRVTDAAFRGRTLLVLFGYTSCPDMTPSALQVLSVVIGTGRPVSEVCRRFDRVPQLLESVRYANGAPLEHDIVRSAIDAGKARLGEAGRLLVRPSGTEPLIRVMAEGDDERLVREVVADIADAVRSAAQAL